MSTSDFDLCEPEDFSTEAGEAGSILPMDVDRSAAAEDESIRGRCFSRRGSRSAERASPAERAGNADGDGVGVVDVMGPPPGPPPGTWAQCWEAPPTWFAAAVQASVEVAMTECMNTMVIPHIEKSVHSALKRSREDTPLWNGGHALTKKTNAGGEWPSQSSKWQAPACTWCYGHFNETETLDWKKAWDQALTNPSAWKAMPSNWRTSMVAQMYNQALNGSKPNYDEDTLSLVHSKLEDALYDPSTRCHSSRFLLLHKTPKLVTLACVNCRKMSTLNYCDLEPRDGKRLHKFFDKHLGGGIWH